MAICTISNPCKACAEAMSTLGIARSNQCESLAGGALLVDPVKVRGVPLAGIAYEVSRAAVRRALGQREPGEEMHVLTLTLDDGTRITVQSASPLTVKHEGTPRCKRCRGEGWIDRDGYYGNPHACPDCNAPSYRIPRR